jgi:periplasmic protein TonB
MEPQDILTNQKKIVDRLHEIQRKAESGKFTDALAIIKEVKTADTKNIYLIAIEKQIAKLCDESLPEESRNGIVKSLPSMLDRAVSDIQRRVSTAKVDESQKEQKEAALEKLKSQYFQRADDYVEKHEYQRALEEIRRIYIIEPGSVVAKEYEKKIEQLAAIHERNEAEKAAAAEARESKSEKIKVTTEAEETKVEAKKQKKAVPDIEPLKEKIVVQLEEEEKKSKLPIIIAAAVAVLAVGIWFIFSRGSSSDTQINQVQTQQTPAQDSVVIPTPETATNSQSRGSASVAETAKPPVKNEKKQPEVKPTTQTQKPSQSGTATQTTQPANTRQQTSTQTAPAVQAQQPAQQQSSATSSNPAPMPFVAIENPPEVIRREPAKYPEIAIKMGIQGRVTIEVTVDAQGKPIQTKVVKSANEVFNDAAIEAVMKYTFKPAMQSNNPVTAKIFIPIDFRLTR